MLARGGCCATDLVAARDSQRVTTGDVRHTDSPADARGGTMKLVSDRTLPPDTLRRLVAIAPDLTIVTVPQSDRQRFLLAVEEADVVVGSDRARGY